jgi:hypothetical protein
MRPPAGKLLCTLGVMLALIACANVGPPQPPSLELPKPPSDLRATRKGNKVVLSWSRPTVTTDRQSLRGRPVSVHICRTLEPSLSHCGTPVGQLTGGATLVGTTLVGSPAGTPSPGKTAPAARITDSYTDLLRNQTISAESGKAIDLMTYAVEAVNANGRSAGLSNQVLVPLVETLPPPQDFTGGVSPQGVVLNWTGALLPKSEQAVQYVYRVYRRLEASAEKRSDGISAQLLVGELPAVTGSMTLTDANIEWEQTYDYRVEAVTVIEQPELQIEGDDSAEVKVFAHDVFPPATPAGLQAVFSGPGQAAFIDLIWAPVTDADLAGYNVYRREESGTPVRVNEEVVKVPAYRDMKVGAGKTYFYSVSAVDLRGNGSARSGETSESVPMQ